MARSIALLCCLSAATAACFPAPKADGDAVVGTTGIEAVGSDDAPYTTGAVSDGDTTVAIDVTTGEAASTSTTTSVGDTSAGESTGDSGEPDELPPGYPTDQPFGAATTCVLALAGDRHELGIKVLRWLMGSFEGRSWGHLAVATAPIGAGLALAVALARDLDALALGDDVAASLGVSPRAVQRRAVTAVALLVGGATAVAGVLGFLGELVKSTSFSGMKDAIVFVLLVIVLLVRPAGLLGSARAEKV